MNNNRTFVDIHTSIKNQIFDPYDERIAFFDAYNTDGLSPSTIGQLHTYLTQRYGMFLDRDGKVKDNEGRLILKWQK